MCERMEGLAGVFRSNVCAEGKVNWQDVHCMPIAVPARTIREGISNWARSVSLLSHNRFPGVHLKSEKKRKRERSKMYNLSVVRYTDRRFTALFRLLSVSRIVCLSRISDPRLPPNLTQILKSGFRPPLPVGMERIRNRGNVSRPCWISYVTGKGIFSPGRRI